MYAFVLHTDASELVNQLIEGIEKLSSSDKERFQTQNA